MKNSNIHIPEPCFESWAGMTPDENGRFCGSCCKVVVDFTVMTPEEIKNYLDTQSGQRTCGRFNVSQLAPEKKSFKERLVEWFDSAQTINVKALHFAAVSFAGMILFLAGCQRKAPVVGYVMQDVNNQPPKQEQVQTPKEEPQYDPNSDQHIKMGKIAAPPQPKLKKKK